MRRALVACTSLLACTAAVTHADPPRPCRAPDRATLVQLERRIRDQHRPAFEGAVVKLAPPACAATFGEELIAERGAGHGGGLTILALQRDGSEIVATRLRVQQRLHGAGPPVTVTAERARLGGYSPVVEHAIERALLAQQFVVTEQAPPPRKTRRGMVHLGGIWASSRDFWLRIGGRSFAGYAGSDTQLTYLGLEVGVVEIEGALLGGTLLEQPIDATARQIFVERFLEHRVDFDKPFHWWVRELYVEAAGVLGTRALLPALRELRDRKVDVEDASGKRTAEAAARAIEELGG